MMNPGPRRNFGPSPQPNKIYSGPDVPAAYDPNWQYFTNLTKEQIAWFQAQPEWNDFVSYVALSPKDAKIATPSATVTASLAAAKIASAGSPKKL